MKLADIKAMFRVGQVWTVTREKANYRIDSREVRTLREVTNKTWEWRRFDGTTALTLIPKASTVSEARPGYVKFKYPSGIIMTLEIVEAAKADPDVIQSNGRRIILSGNTAGTLYKNPRDKKPPTP